MVYKYLYGTLLKIDSIAIIGARADKNSLNFNENSARMAKHTINNNWSLNHYDH